MPQSSRTNNSKNTRQFKGLSLEERKALRRQKLIEAGLQTYGTRGFFAVTIKDICQEAKLTERYFYESFKRSEELFQVVYLNLVNDLQQKIVQEVTQAIPHREEMINAGLTILLTVLKNDPRIARILFIDAVLVHELHGQTINESISLFDSTILTFLTEFFPAQQYSTTQASMIAAGLNGYVIQVAMRWVIGGFEQSFEDVLNTCKLAYLGVLHYSAHTLNITEN